MNTNINLLLPIDEKSLSRKKRIKILSIIAVLFLIGIGVTSLVIFLLIQSTGIASIKEEQSNVMSKISQFRDKQAKLNIAENRINNITEILKIRKDLLKITSAILVKKPDSLLIEDIEVDGKVIALTARSTSLFYIGEFIDNLTEMVMKKEIISSLTLDSLVFDGEINSYQISIKSDL